MWFNSNMFSTEDNILCRSINKSFATLLQDFLLIYDFCSKSRQNNQSKKNRLTLLTKSGNSTLSFVAKINLFFLFFLQERSFGTLYEQFGKYQWTLYRENGIGLYEGWYSCSLHLQVYGITLSSEKLLYRVWNFGFDMGILLIYL